MVPPQGMGDGQQRSGGEQPVIIQFGVVTVGSAGQLATPDGSSGQNTGFVQVSTPQADLQHLRSPEQSPSLVHPAARIAGQNAGKTFGQNPGFTIGSITCLLFLESLLPDMLLNNKMDTTRTNEIDLELRDIVMISFYLK